MANQRIDQLNAETTPAAADVLPVYSIAGSDTKKITVKNLVQQGAALVDDASIPVAKVNLSGISGTNLSAGTVAASKLDTSTIPATGGVTVASSNLQLVAPTSPIVRNAGTGSLEHANSGVTAGTYTKVTVDNKGHVTVGANLIDADLPSPTTTAGTYTKLTIDTKGRVTAGTTLSAGDVPALADTGVTAGAYTKVTVDAKGRVTAGTTLSAGDVPALSDTGISAGTYTKLTVDAKGRASAGTTLAGADLPIATSSVVGGVSIPANGGLALTGGGAVSHSNSVAGGASTRSGISYDAQGHITSTAALVAADLPVATNAVKGAVIAGTGLAVDGNGILSTAVATTNDLGGVKIGSEFGLNASNQLLLATQANVAGGTEYPKVTVNSKGVVTAGAALAAGDIPNLDASKITTGTLDIARIGANTVTGAKLANYSVSKIGDTQPVADHIGQFFFNPLSRDLALWDGNVFQPIGISVGEIVFAGTFDASAGGGTGHVASVTAEGTAIGLVQGSPLPAAATANNRYYLVVSEGGTITSGNAPNVALAPPDIILSTGIEWTEVDVSQTFTSVSASQVAFTPESTIAATNVQAAIEEVNNEKLALAGGTMTGELLIGTTGTFAFEGSTANTYETYLSAVDPTADRAIVFPDQSGTVIVSGNASIVNADINASAAIAYSKLATLTSGNIVLGSSANVATSTAVTGDVTITNAGVTAIAAGVIVDADINASAAIVDTKLATIATAGKVSNSATTAASANTASAIVARDASGNFTAGTITAALTGNASTATTLATARNIQGVSFDGSAAITVVTAGSGISVAGTAVSNTGVLSVNGSTGAITNIAATNAAQSYTAAQRGTVSALGTVSAGTTTLDFATANNFSLTLPAGGSVTLGNPSNQTAGQSGAITITQNGTTAATVPYGGNWKFQGGAPSVNTTLGSVNVIAYYVESASRITAQLLTNTVS